MSIDHTNRIRALPVDEPPQEVTSQWVTASGDEFVDIVPLLRFLLLDDLQERVGRFVQTMNSFLDLSPNILNEILNQGTFPVLS